MNNQMRDRGSNKSQVCVGLEIQVCFVLGFFFGGGGGGGLYFLGFIMVSSDFIRCNISTQGACERYDFDQNVII